MDLPRRYELLRDQSKTFMSETVTVDSKSLAEAIRTEVASHFSPDLVHCIQQIHVFKPRLNEIRARILIVQVRQLTEQYGLNLHWIAPEVIARATREDPKTMLAGHLIEARQAGMSRIRVELDRATGQIQVKPAESTPTDGEGLEGASDLRTPD